MYTQRSMCTTHIHIIYYCPKHILIHVRMHARIQNTMTGKTKTYRAFLAAQESVMDRSRAARSACPGESSFCSSFLSANKQKKRR